MLYIVKKQQHWEDKRYVSGQKSSARAEPPEECSVRLDIVFTCKHHQKCCKYHVLGQTADEWGGCRSFRKFQNVLKMAKAKESVFYYTFCVLYRITAFINRLWGFKNSNVLWIFYNHRLTVKAMNCRKKSMFVSLLLPVCLCFCLGSMHTCAYCLNTACFRKYSFYLLCVCVTERKFVCMCVCLCLLTFTSTPENFGETVVYTAAVLDATFGPVWRLIQLTVNCWPHQVKPVTETCQHTCDLKT